MKTYEVFYKHEMSSMQTFSLEAENIEQAKSKATEEIGKNDKLFCVMESEEER